MPSEIKENFYRELSPKDLETRFVVECVLKQGSEGRTECVQDPYRPDGEMRLIRKYTLSDTQSSSFDWMQQLSHPAFPRVYANYKMEDATGEYSVLLMEYFSGTTLSQLVEATGPFDESRALEVMYDLCSAVAVLHSFDTIPVIHRDLKPSNIMISGGKVKLIDFGTARTRKEAAARDTRLLGTPGYAAPEQFGFQQSDERTDIYALGMVALFITRGLHPEIGGHQNFTGFLEETLPSGVLNSFISKCTQLDPSLRFQNMNEVLSELECLTALKSDANKVEKQADLSADTSDTLDPKSETKPRSMLRRVRFWLITPVFVLFAVVGLSQAFSLSDFGTSDRLILFVQNLTVVLFLFLPLYLCAVSSRGTLRRIGKIGFFKQWWLNYFVIFAVCFTICTAVITIGDAFFSTKYKAWRAEQDRTSTQ